MIDYRAVAAALVLVATPAMADESSFENINGEWVGKGFVQKDENARKMKVNCKGDGEQDPSKVVFEGVCRAMLIMKRDIGVNLTKEGEVLSGTYKGADAGIAQLEGTRTSPNKVELEMVFPRQVHTDDVATMTIDGNNADEFTITTTDQMSSGETIITSQITFQRASSVARN